MELGKVIKAEFKYFNKVSQYEEGEAYDCLETITIESDCIKMVQEIGDGSVITREYKVKDEDFCALITDIGIGEKLKTGLIYLKANPSYELNIQYENGVKHFKGYYAEHDLPKNWALVMAHILDFFLWHGFGCSFYLEEINLSSFDIKHTYVGVNFDDEEDILYYKTNNSEIVVGSKVKVYRASVGQVEVGTVCDIQVFQTGRAPYTLKKSRYVIEKVD